jgi:outer membrane biosynthesis protein TonB
MPQLLEKPEITLARIRARKRVYWALGGAVAIHLLLLVSLASVIPLIPDASTVVQPKPFKLTVERPSDETDQMTAEEKKRRDYLETNPDQEADKPPTDPAFESDKDTLAASEKPAENDKPLPSQDGRDLPWFKFDSKPYVEGEKAANLSSKDNPAPVPTPAPVSAPAPSSNPPRPQPNLAAVTPKPTLTPRDIAMLEPQPTPPSPPEETEVQPEAQSHPPSPNVPRPADPSVQSPGKQTLPGYQPQSEQTKMVGGISNRGRSSAAAIGTPLGRYIKEVQDAIGSRWYFYAQKRSDLISVGTCKISFWINREGKVEGLRMHSNTSSETLASLSIQAIVEARLPPIPPDVAAILPGGRLEVSDYNFTFY